MVTYVLDACAVLRYIDNEAGATTVRSCLEESLSGKAQCIISAIQWSEIFQIILKRRGPTGCELAMIEVRALRLTIKPATAIRAERSAMIRYFRGIHFADAFAVELASGSADHVLITSDYGLKPAEQDCKIDFLPVKPLQ